MFEKLPIPNVDLQFVDWIEPAPKESLQQFAHRLANTIDTSKPFILLGVSFGGILLSEMLDKIHPIHAISVSSVLHYKQIPFLYRWVGKPMLTIMPTRWMNKSNALLYWIFGTKSKAILKEVMDNTDTYFVKWALAAVLTWKRTRPVMKLSTIHGDHDRVLPTIPAYDTHIVKGGGHFMIYDKAKEVGEEINKILTHLNIR